MQIDQNQLNTMENLYIFLDEKKRFYYSKINLELGERLGSALGLGDLEDVETNSLGEGTTLTDGNDITTIGRNVLVHVESKAWWSRYLTNYLIRQNNSLRKKKKLLISFIQRIHDGK